MYKNHKIITIIPALNEEQSIGKVIKALPDFIDRILVSDNGSTDDTARLAKKAGAEVIYEPKRGYGQACISALKALKGEDIIVFLDGDFSDDPSDIDHLLDPIVAGQADMVLSTRLKNKENYKALTPAQRFGNRFACFLINQIWKTDYTDLGPFRAIKADQLARLKMEDTNYGWTIEMQIKAAHYGLKVKEIPLRYRRRIGTSKISGTISGTFKAGSKIIYSVGYYYKRLKKDNQT